MTAFVERFANLFNMVPSSQNSFSAVYQANFVDFDQNLLKLNHSPKNKKIKTAN